MINWWNSLTSLQQVFAFIAIPSSIVLIIQTIMLFFGFDGDDLDTSGDLADGGDGLALFSIRGIVGFLAIGGWTGIAMIDFGLNVMLSVLIAFIAGLVTLIAIAFLFKAALKLQSSGNINFKNAISQTGKVYVTIPANAKGNGKITAVIQERFIEADAITFSSSDLKTGELVKITGVQDNSVFIVEPASKKQIK